MLSMMQTLPLDVNLEILRLPSKQAEVDRMQHLVEERLQASLAYFQRQADASQRQPQDEGQKQNPEQKAKLEAQLWLKKSHAATPASKAGTTGRRRVDDMCYDRRRAEACVDESGRSDILVIAALSFSGGTHVQKLGTLVGGAIGSREDHSDEKIPHHEVGWSPLRTHPINVRG